MNVPRQLTGNAIDFTTVKTTLVALFLGFGNRSRFRENTKSSVINYTVNTFDIANHIVIENPYDFPVVLFGIFGKTFAAKEVAGVVESVKAAADVYMPVDGEITEVNEELRGDPSLANTDPLGKGWFFKVKLSNPAQTDALLDETAYKAFSAG